MVHVRQGVELATVGKRRPLLAENLRTEDCLDPEQVGVLTHARRVLVSLIAGGMRDHELARDVESAQKLDRPLDSLALHNARRLKDELLFRLDAAKALILGADAAGVAQAFLKPATKDNQSTILEVDILIKELRTAMFLVGADNLDKLINVELKFSQDLIMWE